MYHHCQTDTVMQPLCYSRASCLLPPTKEEVHVFARVCLLVSLSISKITQKRMHGFGWNVVCRQMLGHGRDELINFWAESGSLSSAETGLLSPISYRLRNFAALPRLPASCAAVWNFISGKIPCILISGAPLERAFTEPSDGAKCTLPSSLLVVMLKNNWIEMLG